MAHDNNSQRDHDRRGSVLDPGLCRRSSDGLAVGRPNGGGVPATVGVDDSRMDTAVDSGERRHGNQPHPVLRTKTRL